MEMLTLLWQDLMFNFRLFVNEKTNRYDCAIEPPFIMRNYGEVARNLETGSRYLTIVTYAFIRMFELEVELLLQFEATKKLKDFVDYFVGNVFTNAPYFGQDLGQSLWIISVLD